MLFKWDFIWLDLPSPFLSFASFWPTLYFNINNVHSIFTPRVCIILKSVIFLPFQLSLSFNFKNSLTNIWIVRLSPALAKPLLILLKSFSVPEENPSSCINFSTLNCSCLSEEAERVMFSWRPWSFPPKTALHHHLSWVLCCWHPPGLGHQTHPKTVHQGFSLELRAQSLPPLMSKKWILPHYKPVGCSQQDLQLLSTHGWSGAGEGPSKLGFLWMDRERNVITSLSLWARLDLR